MQVLNLRAQKYGTVEFTQTRVEVHHGGDGAGGERRARFPWRRLIHVYTI